ncbi:hypothetical protein AVEN_93290-1 [Araneus ventricosus]|uniref:Uncharacterized protein n=1 Tax=Araneus ventricosus TaxID=182803 RepID=A0A4Y2WKH5_ARAVE|nr:hypothetical protein AVEN_233256-1 [Araneus ventricosus]GBO37711.1 hypothetical protein AVEN_15255-1 [Araneus ventricosus]GBO37719.1 hypothetical protein AVEN_11573-1 [Araneus ventricosus]GBO37722.1 hypothetical protein AVEN_93290-1 [Araneus ventricosus]
MAVIRIAAILKPSKMADIWRLFGWLALFPMLARNRTIFLSLWCCSTVELEVLEDPGGSGLLELGDGLGSAGMGKDGWHEEARRGNQ